jgi:hypothetical protein
VLLMGVTIWAFLRKPPPEPPPDIKSFERQFFETTFRLAEQVPDVLARRTNQVTGGLGGRQSAYSYVAEMEFENRDSCTRALQSAEGKALVANLRNLPARTTVLMADRVLEPPFNVKAPNRASTPYSEAADRLDEAAYHYRMAAVAIERADHAGARQHAARAQEIAQAGLERGGQIRAT